ncbi:hypothetical protein GJ496_006994 [Pomphorhynchus laevis]|nr:hypothetical protein GJ496_006994 [Pomphorhynchus laevis]
MANRTIKEASSIKGTNPQYLIEKIIRSRIYDSRYWKEECFALTAELLVDKSMALKFIGGVYGGNPDKDIVVEFIQNEDYKYVRALGAFYMRLTGTSTDVYKYLEPLYNDYRKIKMLNRGGKFELIYVDEFIDNLLHEERVCDIQLPRLQKRHVLEETGLLEARISLLENDLEEIESNKSDSESVDSQSSNRRHKRRHDYDKPNSDDTTKSHRRSQSRRAHSRSRRRRRRSNTYSSSEERSNKSSHKRKHR